MSWEPSRHLSPSLERSQASCTCRIQYPVAEIRTRENIRLPGALQHETRTQCQVLPRVPCGCPRAVLLPLRRAQAGCTGKQFGLLQIPWALSCSVHRGPAPEATISLKRGHLCGAFSYIKLAIVNPCLFVTSQILHVREFGKPGLVLLSYKPFPLEFN